MKSWVVDRKKWLKKVHGILILMGYQKISRFWSLEIKANQMVVHRKKFSEIKVYDAHWFSLKTAC